MLMKGLDQRFQTLVCGPNLAHSAIVFGLRGNAKSLPLHSTILIPKISEYSAGIWVCSHDSVIIEGCNHYFIDCLL